MDFECQLGDAGRFGKGGAPKACHFWHDFSMALGQKCSLSCCLKASPEPLSGYMQARPLRRQWRLFTRMYVNSPLFSICGDRVSTTNHCGWNSSHLIRRDLHVEQPIFDLVWLRRITDFMVAIPENYSFQSVIYQLSKKTRLHKVQTVKGKGTEGLHGVGETSVHQCRDTETPRVQPHWFSHHSDRLKV